MMSKIIRINEITKEDLSRFDAIDKNCLAMHVCPPPKTFINMRVHNPNGELMLDYDMPSRSWVRNAYNLLTIQVMNIACNSGGDTFGAGKMPIKDTSGDARQSAYGMTISDGSNAGGIVSPASGDSSLGIVIGTGTTAESFEHHSLSAQISHGTGSGQISYAAHSAKGFAYDAGTKKYTATIARVFENSSGGSITVSECGMIVYLGSPTVSYSIKALMCRDLLSSPIAVANTAQLTVTYTIEMTYPA